MAVENCVTPTKIRSSISPFTPVKDNSPNVQLCTPPSKITVPHEKKIENFKQTDLYKNFQPGDLLYGFKTVRAFYIPLLADKCGDTNAYVTVDRLNQKVKIIEKGQQIETVESDDETASAYLAHLNKIASGKKPKGLNIIRGCKWAMLWEKRTIHFCLDGIDLERVLTQQKQNEKDPSKIEKDRSYTTAELRYLYKNWDLISKTNQVIFYQDNKACMAPWVVSPEYWQNNFRSS